MSVELVVFYELLGSKLKVSRAAAKRILLLLEQEGLVKIVWRSPKGAYLIPMHRKAEFFAETVCHFATSPQRGGGFNAREEAVQNG